MNIKKYFKELKIKPYEIKFKHQKFTERGCEDEIRISPKIYFYNKDKFNCLSISNIHVTEIKQRFVADVYIGFSELSRPFNDFFTNVEVKKINEIFEELIKDFKIIYETVCSF